MEQKHIPVLLNELVSYIKIEKDKQNIIVDCTLWLAWHAKEIIKKMHKWDIFIGFDADIRNLELAKKNLENLNDDVEKIFINSNFVNLKKELEKLDIKQITWIYYDLWISSLHIDEKERWFSFRFEWPLDMRFDTNSWIKASEIINTYKEKDLLRVFKTYWEDPLSKKIVNKINEIRKTDFKFNTTKDLADFLEKISKDPKTKARIFQALRIETNKELENLEISLKDAIELLEKNWVIFVISFHSLEDRIVKNIFRDETKNCICKDLFCTCKHKKRLKLINKKAIIPSEIEEKINPRSRSAKARWAIKV